MIYQRYLELDINGSLIGLEQSKNENTYFCTPRGASILGWAGVDGIHFCFVPGFGEMVFAVSPMNTPGSYVHPLARSFGDFLRLLLACGHTGALEQAWCWEQDGFDAYLRENTPTDAQAAVLHRIGEELSLSPMEQPFHSIRALQDRFDYRLIPYTQAYYDTVSAEPPIPEWKVYFEESFWGHHSREKAGKEMCLNRQFSWNGQSWIIPAIYICDKGLVVDFCLQVPPERIRTFAERWNLSADSDGSDFTDEQQLQIDAQNPLAVQISPTALLNGSELQSSHGSGLCWNPCFPEGNSLEAWSVMLHYGLDPEQGYAIWRSAFPWKTKGTPAIKTLDIALTQEPVAMPGARFSVSSPGDQFEFIHPSTGNTHTLTVQEYEGQELSKKHFNDPNLELPTHYIMMTYALSPDLPNQAFTVSDCASSDRPRQNHADPREPQATGDVGISIIGGSDGPTAIFIGGGHKSKLHAACSGLHFDPVAAVEWRMVFYEKTGQDITVKLL